MRATPATEARTQLLPHRIRLRGPWEHDSLANCFSRRFHQPTGLTAATRVWLVIDECTASAQIVLNGNEIGAAICSRPARFDITADLQPNNLLAITLTDPQSAAKSPHGSPIGLVELEIEQPAT